MTSLARIALKFELDAIPNGADIDKATLSFNRIGDYYGYDMSGTYEVHLINKSWSSGTANWNNLSSSYNQAVVASFSYRSGTTGWFDFDVTDEIVDMFADPSKNFGFMLLIDFQLNVHTNGHISEIHSSESDEESKRPKLTVEYSGVSPITTGNNRSGRKKLLVQHQSGNLLVTTSSEGVYSVLVHDGKGRQLSKIDKRYLGVGTNTIPFEIDRNQKGIFIVTVKGNEYSVTNTIAVY